MTNEEEKEPKTSAGREIQSTWETLGPTLGALATGVGLLAFVALFGGAILWDRADQAGLPGTEAVAVMPRSLLLSTGSHFIAWSLVFSVIAVTGLWFIDTVLQWWAKSEAEKEAERAQKRVRDRATSPDEGTSESNDVAAAAEAVALKMAEANAAQEKVSKAKQELQAALAEDKDATEKWANRTAAIEKHRNLEEELQQARHELTRKVIEMRENRSRVVRLGALAALLLGLELGLVQYREWLGTEQVSVLILVSLITTVVAVAVYQRTRKFSWFAVVAFLGISAVQGVAAHYEINAKPVVEPAAILIGGQRPVTGVFVGQTADQIYLGISDGAIGESASLVALPRNRVTALAVGRLTDTADADELAAKLVATLCAQLPEPATEKQRRALPQC